MDYPIGVGLYVKGSREAADLYQKAFCWTLGYHVLNEDGSYFHSELLDKGQGVLSVVEAPEDSPKPIGNPVELGRTFQTEEALRRAFALLKEGGHVKMEVRELPWSPSTARRRILSQGMKYEKEPSGSSSGGSFCAGE